MKRGEIEITQRDDSSIAINIDTTNGEIWVTRHEIANLFQIYISAVNANLRVLFKNKELDEYEVCKEEKLVTYYNLDVIIALAFRCKGPICKRFRIWLRNQAKRPMKHQQPILIQIGKDAFLA